MLNLSSSQRIAVESSEKYVLIVAGAGSGKTRVLTERILRCIQNLPFGRKAIGITFSNKAADELKNRLVNQIDEDELSSKSFIGTLHAFFMDFVNQRGLTIGLPNSLQICANDDDRLAILVEAIKNVNPRLLSAGIDEIKDLARKYLREISCEKQNLREPELIEPSNPILSRVYAAYDNELLSQGMIDYDDILRYSYRILNEVPGLASLYRRIYSSIFIDEGQDLNYAQYTLIKALAGTDMGITIVGDPKQAIYGFNGSSSRYMMSNFKADFHPFVCEIPENFRSSKQIVDAARQLEPDYKPNLNLPYEGVFEVFSACDSKGEAEEVFKRFQKLSIEGHSEIEGKYLKPESCAVIARNRYAFRDLQSLFSKRGIPFTEKVQSPKEISAESDQFSLFILGLTLFINPLDKIHLASMNRHLANLSYKPVRSLSDLVSSVDDSLITTLNKAWMYAYNNGENAQIDQSIGLLREFSQSLNESEEHLIFDDDIASFEKIYRSFVRLSSPGNRNLRQFLLDVSLGKLIEQITEGVTFTTVHMSKGLEYDAVFIVGVTEGGFPDYRAVRSFENGNESPMEEEKHNMFVAITRAKRICYVSYPEFRTNQFGTVFRQSPSRFIDIISEKLIE